MRIAPRLVAGLVALGSLARAGLAIGGDPSGDDDDGKRDNPAWDVAAAHGPGRDVDFTVSEGTWLNVDVSPDGQRVLFDLLGDLYEVPITGGAAVKLSGGNAWDTDAYYSADGTRIVFDSDRGGSENLWVMNADGTDATALTEEDHDRWTDPVWAPEPGWILGRKRMTDTRSIGIQELWLLHEQGGKGVRLTTLEEHPHAGEAAFSPDGRSIWFSTRAGRFEYDQDIHNGIWQIARYDRDRDEVRVETRMQEGAVRPTPSADGRSVAFVSRDRTKTVLMLLDVETGKVRRLTDDLDKDAMEAFELRGAYPRMDWTPDGRALVYWARGHLWRLDVGNLQKTMIPFSVQVELRVTNAVRPVRRTDQGPVEARVIRWPARAPDGTVYAAAVGRLWALSEKGGARALTPDSVTAYFPSLSADGKTLTYTTWSDANGGQVWSGPIGGARQITRLAGDLQSPVLSPDGKSIAYLRARNATPTGGDLGGESEYDLYLTSASGGDGIRLRHIPFRGSGYRAPRLQFSPDGQRIYWVEDEFPEPRAHEKTVLKSCDRLGHDERVHVRFDAAQEVRFSPDGRWLAYKHDHQAWIAAFPAQGTRTMEAEELPSRKLTDVVGDWVDFSNGEVTWAEADRFYSVPIEGLLDNEAEEIPPARDREMRISVPRPVGAGTVAFTHARVVTMDEAGVIDDATLVVRDDRILALGRGLLPPADARVIDLKGKTILPGLIDVHAHLHYASGDLFPEQEWRHLANLAYGVTTVFDPSAATDLVFGQAELIEAGRMIGPRTLSTGFILYGADDSQGAKIDSYEDAEHHVLRLLRMGAWGVKSYQQPRRDQRQWIVEACRKLGMLDVPEGGGDLFNNLGMILDGHSSIEHALPVAPVYMDVKGLWSRSDTTYVPTLLVAYGGVSGEHANYQSERVWEDPRLTRFVPPEVLRGRGYRLPLYITDEAEFHHRAVARDAATLQAMGARVALGGHGQMQGLGPHWEMEHLGGAGAMSPLEALRAATIDGAIHLGLDQDIGSLREGKLADLFVVDGDPTVNLRAAREVVYVMKAGLLYEGLTMNPIAPMARTRAPTMWELAHRAMDTAWPVQKP